MGPVGIVVLFPDAAGEGQSIDPTWRRCQRLARHRFLTWWRMVDGPDTVELSDITDHSNYTDKDTWALSETSWTHRG